jgi:hypothetical protein
VLAAERAAPPPVIGLRGREIRVAGAGMITVAATWSVLPHLSVACPLRAATGIPCPFCGMTRAVVAAVHGNVAASLAFNPGGIVVLALAIVAVVCPAWLRRVQLPLWTLFAALAGLWFWNVGFNPTFHQLLLR